MGAVAAVIAGVGAVFSADRQRQQQRRAERASRRAQESQQEMNREQRAQQSAESARERRSMVREERVRRAQITAGSQAAGTLGSSGFLGASSGLSTQLGSNLGFQQASINRAGRIGGLMDQGSMFQQQAAGYQSSAQTWGALYGLSSSIFQSQLNFSGGTGQTNQPPAPVVERSFN